jgi:Tol biopolymer transport system component
MASMNPDRSVEDRISAWLQSEAPDQLPDRVLRATFQRTSAGRERRVLGWRRFGILSMTPATAAAGFVAIALVVAGAVLLQRANPPYGGNPTPAPTPTPTANSGPTLEPVSLNGQIAFERTVEGNADIYLMNLDRTGLQRLTDDPAIDSGPTWSPDGSRIAFTRGAGEARDVFVMNADGSGEAQVTHTAAGEEAPAFSPDGSEIAVLRYEDPAYFDLYVIAADGSNERRVYHQDVGYAAHPVWAADGRALYFNLDWTPGGGLDVARLDLATGAVSRVTNFAGDDSTFGLSADGSTIAFQSDREPGGIFLMDVDGTNVRYLTGNQEKGLPLSWSPDGQHLAFNDDIAGWISLASIDGGAVIRWTEGGPGVAWRPTT